MTWTPTDKDLKLGVGHVEYEWEMLEFAVQMTLQTHSSKKEVHTAYNAVWLHSRNLYHFFLDTKRQCRDALAIDYAAPPWLPSGLNRDALHKIEKRASQYVLHISYQRNTPLATDQSEIRAIVGPLNRMAREFVEAVRDRFTFNLPEITLPDDLGSATTTSESPASGMSSDDVKAIRGLDE